MKIGFTVGCWDVFHKGHRNHLTIALNECDFLIIGIVTDWLVKMQKGCNPYDSYDLRKQNLHQFLNEKNNFKTIPIDSLQQNWISDVIDIAFVGEDQIDRFYEHPKNFVKEKKIIKRLPDISSTLIKEKFKLKSNRE
jgi:glycerol-3-phosphate cytidylyltransferase